MNFLLNRGLGFYVLSIILLGCSEQDSNKEIKKEVLHPVRVVQYNLDNEFYDIGYGHDFRDYFEIDSSSYLAYYSNKKFRIANLDQHKIIVDVSINDIGIKSISAVDTNHFGIEYQDSLVIYNNGSKEIVTDFNDRLNKVRFHTKAFMLSKDEDIDFIIGQHESSIDTKTGKQKKEPPFKLSDKTKIEYMYPAFYQGALFGRLHACGSYDGNDNFVVSSLYENQIYHYNLDKKTGKYVDLFMEEIFPHELPKDIYNGAENRMGYFSAMNYLTTYFKHFGPAFYDEDKDRYIRLYQKKLDKYDEDGNVNGLGGLEYVFIVKDKHGLKFYQLPTSAYHVYHGWEYENGKLVYLQYNRKTTDETDSKYEAIALHYVYLD